MGGGDGDALLSKNVTANCHSKKTRNLGLRKKKKRKEMKRKERTET